jgi:PAS domain S-box-containing protein
MIGHLQQLPIEHFSASMQVLELEQAVVVPRVAELPDTWAGEREIAQLQSIQSILLVPLLQDERLIGFVGFDAVQAPRDWSEAEVRFLRVFSSILVSAFERARTYTELRESNLRYDELACQSRIVNWEVDAEGLFTYLGPAVEAVTGYRREDLVGRKHFFDLTPEAMRSRVRSEALQRFGRRDCLSDYTNPIRCADGSTIWVLTNGAPVVAEDGTLLGYRGTDVDITERHRAQEQLEESEALLSAVFENAPIGIAIAGPNRRLHRANRMLGEFLGYDPQDLLGMRFDELTCQDDLPTELDLFRELAAGQRNLYRMTKRYRKADGSHVLGDLRVVLLPGRADDRPMALGMVEDITEIQAATERKRELEAALLHYTENLESLVDLASRHCLRPRSFAPSCSSAARVWAWTPPTSERSGRTGPFARSRVIRTPMDRKSGLYPRPASRSTRTRRSPASRITWSARNCRTGLGRQATAPAFEWCCSGPDQTGGPASW